MKKIIKILLAPFKFIKNVVANLFKKKPNKISFDDFLSNYKKSISTKSNVKANFSGETYNIELIYQNKEKAPQTAQKAPKTKKEKKQD